MLRLFGLGCDTRPAWILSHRVGASLWEAMGGARRRGYSLCRLRRGRGGVAQALNPMVGLLHFLKLLLNNRGRSLAVAFFQARSGRSGATIPRLARFPPECACTSCPVRRPFKLIQPACSIPPSPCGSVASKPSAFTAPCNSVANWARCAEYCWNISFMVGRVHGLGRSTKALFGIAAGWKSRCGPPAHSPVKCRAFVLTPVR